MKTLNTVLTLIFFSPFSLPMPQVEDANGAPLSGALVSLSGTNFRSNGFTESNGELRFSDLVSTLCVELRILYYKLTVLAILYYKFTCYNTYINLLTVFFFCTYIHTYIHTYIQWSL